MTDQINSQQAIQRISTLWAITECGLGGFFHAVKSPFTGLILGGLSVVYISLIAWHSKHKWRDISKSLLFVLVVKFIVSPHSPLGAYVAVSMQAFLGMVFFTIVPHFRLAAVITGILSTVGSALQKVLILIVLFGTPLWKAVDGFVLSVAGKMEFLELPETFSATQWLVGIYVGTYFVGGAVIGILAGSMPGMLLKREAELRQVCSQFKGSSIAAPDRKGKGFKYLPFLVIGMAMLVFVLEFYLISAETAIHQLVRTMLIIVVWLLIVNPLLRYMLARFLKSKSEKYETQISRVRDMLPRLIAFARFAWANGQRMEKGWKISNFILLMIYFGMYEA